MTPPVVLSVAGTDSGGAAGLAADLATFAALGAHGACAVTAITAQDTTGVHAIHPVPAATVGAQVDAVLADLPVTAAKTGMLGSAETVAMVAERLGHVPLVVDPVLVATSGAVLGDAEVAKAYRDVLLPRATVVTPNQDEAVALIGHAGDPDELAAALTELCPAVVLTGGRLDGECTDWLAIRGQPPIALTHAAVETTNDHGTGCTHSAALAVHLARGADLPTATLRAAEFTRGQLVHGRAWRLGRGRGPIAHTTPTHRGES